MLDDTAKPSPFGVGEIQQDSLRRVWRWGSNVRYQDGDVSPACTEAQKDLSAVWGNYIAPGNGPKDGGSTTYDQTYKGYTYDKRACLAKNTTFVPEGSRLNTWTPNAYAGAWMQMPGRCEMDGHNQMCEDEDGNVVDTSQSVCTGGGTWTEGYCSDPSKTTVAQCIEKSGTWVPAPFVVRDQLCTCGPETLAWENKCVKFSGIKNETNNDCGDGFTEAVYEDCFGGNCMVNMAQFGESGVRPINNLFAHVAGKADTFFEKEVKAGGECLNETGKVENGMEEQKCRELRERGAGYVWKPNETYTTKKKQLFCVQDAPGEECTAIDTKASCETHGGVWKDIYNASVVYRKVDCDVAENAMRAVQCQEKVATQCATDPKCQLADDGGCKAVPLEQSYPEIKWHTHNFQPELTQMSAIQGPTGRCETSQGAKVNALTRNQCLADNKEFNSNQQCIGVGVDSKRTGYFGSLNDETTCLSANNSWIAEGYPRISGGSDPSWPRSGSVECIGDASGVKVPADRCLHDQEQAIKALAGELHALELYQSWLVNPNMESAIKTQLETRFNLFCGSNVPGYPGFLSDSGRVHTFGFDRAIGFGSGVQEGVTKTILDSLA